MIFSQQLQGSHLQFAPHLHACPPSLTKLASLPSSYLHIFIYMYLDLNLTKMNSYHIHTKNRFLINDLYLDS
ncbi:hypothetical protein Hanom_Chr06g00516211 [Helianthus anomalus]